MARVRPGPRKDKAPTENEAMFGSWQGRMRLWIEIVGRGTIGPGKLRLLEAIAVTRSLSAAAKRLNMSYRLAWQHLRAIEERLGIAVVEPHRGGRQGGGTELTPEGAALIEAYQMFRRDVQQQMESAFCRHFARWLPAQAKKTVKSSER